MAENIFDAARKHGNAAVGNAVVAELNKRGFKALYAVDKAAALAEVLKLIPENTRVGVPGSVSIRELGAFEALAKRGCVVLQHWDKTGEASLAARFDENNADYFLTSANALTRDGEIINIDGVGNRVSAMAFGNGVLIFVIGINKIVDDIQAGIKRAKQVAVINNVRLNHDTPCVKVGRCVNCMSDERSCRATLILELPTRGRETHVIVVGESLGF